MCLVSFSLRDNPLEANITSSMWPHKNTMKQLANSQSTRFWWWIQYFETSNTNKNKKTTRTSDVYKSKVGHKHGQLRVGAKNSVYFVLLAIQL